MTRRSTRALALPVLVLVPLAIPSAAMPLPQGNCPAGTTPLELVVSSCFPADCTSLQSLPWGVPVPEMLLVPKFDPALGTLLSVEVVLETQFQGSLCIDNTSSSCAFTSAAVHFFCVVLPGASNSPALTGLDASQVYASSVLLSPGFGLGPSDGVDDCAAPSGRPSSGNCTPGEDHVLETLGAPLSSSPVLLSGSDLLPWIAGTGGAHVEFETFADGIFDVTSGPNTTIVKQMSSSAAMRVTYRYCPSPLGTSFCDCTSAPPCGNYAGAGEGCANSTGLGAVLSASGSGSLAAADLVLHGAQLPAGQSCLFFQGTLGHAGGAGSPLGDGLLCAGGTIRRLEVGTSDAGGDATSTVNLALASGATAGEKRTYQLWYRDPIGSPCTFGYNLSNGLELTWAP